MYGPIACLNPAVIGDRWENKCDKSAPHGRPDTAADGSLEYSVICRIPALHTWLHGRASQKKANMKPGRQNVDRGSDCLHRFTIWTLRGSSLCISLIITGTKFSNNVTKPITYIFSVFTRITFYFIKICDCIQKN